MTQRRVEVGISPCKLAGVIRFHLSDLGARNAHHEFEHLARHVARARIASNILPATGPVSSGGDRGRDFETFATKHTASAPVGNGFSARSTGHHRIVFAVSLEKKIEAKIRKDVSRLAKQDDVDEIAYFCEANLPVAKRLKLIEEAAAAGLTLQIFDGTTIAEWLAEPDIFWIAEEYLHLPSDLAPAAQLEEGYVEHREKWRPRTPIPISRADFLAVKAGLRKATFDDSVKPDLRFWLTKMARFLADPTPRDLVRDAMYEIAVANLRGRGDLNPAAHLVRDYFSDVAQHASIGEITDAVVLLTYCYGARGLGQYVPGSEEIEHRRHVLKELFNQCLAAAALGPGRRAGLLRMRGTLELIPESPDLERAFLQAFATWREMLDCAEKAPLFPIEEFVDHLTLMIGNIGETDELLSLAARADDLLASRAGNAVAGEKAIDRAFGLLDRDEPLAAIRELHKAKAKWFSGERLAGMLRILLLLAELYGRLGLAYASKYHALAAAYIARHEDAERVGDMLPRALLDLLDAEDAAGNSLGYIQLFPVMMVAHVEHDDRPFDMTEHPRLGEQMGQIAALLGFLKRGNEQARGCVDRLADEWPSEVKGPIWTAAAQRDAFWTKGSWDEAWRELEDALLDRPFGDLGQVRRVTWTALGIEWRVDFENDYSVVPDAEQLIAELQLAACGMAGRDLGIVPCTITLKVVRDSEGTELEFAIPEDHGCEIDVTLPGRDRDADSTSESVALFAAVLHSCSALPDRRLMAAFDPRLFDPIYVGRPYAELYRAFVTRDLFAHDLRMEAGAFESQRAFRSTAGDRVPWFDGPGPTYDHGEAQRDIAHRYKQTQASLQHTLPKLLADRAVMTHLADMHDRGLKDWEILSILSNVAINHRIAQDGEMTMEQWRDRAMAMIGQPEQKEEALDTAVFSGEQIEQHAESYRAAFLAGRELRAPSCFSTAGLEQFLVARYRLREDDVEHADVFGWSCPNDADDR